MGPGTYGARPGLWSVFGEDVDVVELDWVEGLFLVVDLEVDPEFGCGAEGLGEAVGEWYGDGLFAVDDVGDGFEWHVDCGGHVVVVEVERLHEVVVECFAGRAEVDVVGHDVLLSFLCFFVYTLIIAFVWSLSIGVSCFVLGALLSSFLFIL